MERTQTKKTVDEPLHGSPINHNILYQDVGNKLKNLKTETNLLMLRLTKEIGVDYVKRLLLDSYPLTCCYDMLEELLAEQDEDNDTLVIVISSDTEPPLRHQNLLIKRLSRVKYWVFKLFCHACHVVSMVC
ncbi:hypothetical protein A4A49_55099 [Nicotiana attenuata]|uniref:Uncharacterized protein n=1 Tax=Nicotiana attenuata TaxID=49451 RepID=A0A1J6JR96_NICAT|nr:hypothetical protein A4A49_55099 [Nicotiana attenuata]